MEEAVKDSQQMVEWLDSGRGLVVIGSNGRVHRYIEMDGVTFKTGTVILPDGRRMKIAYSEGSDRVFTGRAYK